MSRFPGVLFDEQILDILRTLQQQVTIQYGKMSAVFEYVDGVPISHVREFAPRVDAKGQSNLCEHMIDCQANPFGSRTCKDSDAAAANESRSKLKKILYRCHGGLGFVNLAVPIKIWEKIVVLNLYMGQCLLKISRGEYSEFSKRLNARSISMMDGQSVENILGVSTLDEDDIYSFYQEVIPSTLQPQFQWSDFREQFKKQQENGMSIDEFFNAVDLLDKIADRLSELGNLLYTLKAFVDINTDMPRSLAAQIRPLIRKLGKDIQTLVLEKKNDGPSAIERMEAVDDFHQGYLEILLLLKNHKTEYVQSLLKPYMEYVLERNRYVDILVLKFLFLKAQHEAQRYSKAMEIARRLVRRDLPRADLVEEFFKIAKDIGENGGLENVVSEGIIGLYNNAPTIWRPRLSPDKLISILMHVHRNNKSIVDTILRTHGLHQTVGFALQNAKDEKISEYVIPLPLLAKRLENIRKEFAETNDEVARISKEMVEPEISEIRDYIDRISEVQADITDLLAFDSDQEFKKQLLENRAQMDLRYDRFFLNSGGLGPTLLRVIEEQEWWMAKRNEEGPVGINLEKTLRLKIEDCRKSTCRLLGASSEDDIAFTYGTTDGVEFILNSIHFRPNDEVVFTDVEFNSIENFKNYLFQKYSVLSNTANVSECINDNSKIAERIAEQITPRTRLVIVSHIAYGTGSVLPVKEISDKCRYKYENLPKGQHGSEGSGLLILVDGAQAVGNIAAPALDLGCDFYAFDGHKWLQGPEGSGAVYIKDFLNKIESRNFHFPVTRAFMVSEKCERVLNQINDGKEREKATADVSKIIGFGKAAELFLAKDPNEIALRKTRLVERFLNGIQGIPHFAVMNAEHAKNTGMVCLRLKEVDEPEEYRRIVEELQKRNVYVRFIKKPACIRIGFHFNFNNETDVDVILGALRVVVEGVSIHRADLKEVKRHLEDLIVEYFNGNHNSGGKAGLILFGPSGTGKTIAIPEILYNLKKNRIIKDSSTVTLEKLRKNGEDPAQRFTEELVSARRHAPFVVFFEECDQLLSESQAIIVSDFNTQCDIVLRNKERKDGELVFFLGTTNKLENICPPIRKRMNTAYWPLPSFETRLEFLMDKSRKCENAVHDVAYERIAGKTDGYSMSNMEEVWNVAMEIAKQQAVSLETEHLEEAIKKVPKTTADGKIKEYEHSIREFGSIILTNRSVHRFRTRTN